MSRTSVTQLMPTLSIKDDATRAVIDSLIQVVEERSGFTNKDNPDRFVTAREFDRMAGSALAVALADSVFGDSSAAGTNPTTQKINKAIDNLADGIRRTLIYQLLGEVIAPLAPPSINLDSIRKSVSNLVTGLTNEATFRNDGDVQIGHTLDAVVGRVGNAEGAIIHETDLRVSANSVIVSDANKLYGRVGTAEGAIIETARLKVLEDGVEAQYKIDIAARVGDAEGSVVDEMKIRVTKDGVLASAILKMWATVGGSSAIIEDQTLASVTPTVAEATKWNQVVASVTDPNTGLVNSASIKAEAVAYANSANNTFNSIYSVRAQTDVNGRKLVGGFGLSATAGAGSAPGDSINFGVRADTFFIAATSETPDANYQIGQGNSIPFMVLTSNQIVNGVNYAPGVYLKKAVIGAATIGNAQIADASITNAKIGDAQITNAKIGGDISSTNFDPGNPTNGWYLNRSGYFQCTNIYARGNIEATSMTTNTLSAKHIISNSLNQFFTSTSGSASFSLDGVTALAIIIEVTPGYTQNPKNGQIGYNTVYLYLDGSFIGSISGTGTISWYSGIGSGNHTLVVSNVNGGNGSSQNNYMGRTNLQVMVR